MTDQFEITRQYWGGAIRKGNLIYPNDQVIRFIKRNYKEKDISILDFGCGGGRNTVALLSEGYNVIAMDYTDDAVSMTKDKIRQLGIENPVVVKNSGFEVPIEADSIDAVIADGSLFYYSRENIVKIIENIKSVMKNNGLLWADFRTKHDSLFERGKQIDDGLFILGEGTDREGCSYFFADESDIRSIFDNANMEIVSIDDYSYSENNHRVINSWFHVIARKSVNVKQNYTS